MFCVLFHVSAKDTSSEFTGCQCLRYYFYVKCNNFRLNKWKSYVKIPSNFEDTIFQHAPKTTCVSTSCVGKFDCERVICWCWYTDNIIYCLFTTPPEPDLTLFIQLDCNASQNLLLFKYPYQVQMIKKIQKLLLYNSMICHSKKKEQQIS